ncbi:hypothetical protein QOZ80_7AG0582900 [Eleusine coracana subsp. coracana]|nr:hypothetical protein QOZ80_7AG0582900 [Eleusine coracana subsp. coracana]
MSASIDLNNSMAAADPQAQAPPPKRGRGRPRKNPPPPAHPRPPDPDAPRVGGFATGDMVWGKKLNHAAWPGLVYATGANDQLLVSYFGDKAFAWCHAADLKPYEPYFPVAELYDDGGDDFDAALEASLDEFTRRVEATLAIDHSSARRPFVPADFIALLHGLAADRMGFTNRVHAAVAKAHATAFDKFRALPDPPQYTLHIGLPLLDNLNTSSSRRGRKQRIKVQEVEEEDSDEDWDPRKRGGAGATDSDSDATDLVASRTSSRGGGTGRPRGRPRKTPPPAAAAADATKAKDEEIMEYPSAAEMLIRLSSVAADPANAVLDSVPLIVSFFSKYKDSNAPSIYQHKELLHMFGTNKGRKKCPPTKAQDGSDTSDQLVTADGQRGRRKSAGSLYSARKAEDSYWCDIIISDFDDGDSDYEGRKRKRPSQNRTANKRTKQEEPPNAGTPAQPPSDDKPADGPAALILQFTSAEAIPSVDDINSIFRIHGPIVEHETQITANSKSAKVVFSKRADAERAYSSSGKYNAFGPSLLTYEIKYLPSASQVS